MKQFSTFSPYSYRAYMAELFNLPENLRADLWQSVQPLDRPDLFPAGSAIRYGEDEFAWCYGGPSASPECLLYLI